MRHKIDKHDTLFQAYVSMNNAGLTKRKRLGEARRSRLKAAAVNRRTKSAGMTRNGVKLTNKGLSMNVLLRAASLIIAFFSVSLKRIL